MHAVLIWCNVGSWVSGVMEVAVLCDGVSYGCVPHEGTGVMGVSVFAC